MYSIKHLFHINAPREKVYKALTTIDGLSNWWTTDTSGSSALEGILEFRFGQWVNSMKVTGMQDNEFVSWECVGGADDWLKTTISFRLDENEGKTRVRFAHEGWPSNGDFYANCSFAWALYMESLRQYCQTGKGEAFGSENFKR